MQEIEIYKQHREAQNKYAYFLLAVAASAIALSLKRTTNLKITYSMIPLALAVLSWGFSFFCGCRRLDKVRDGGSALKQSLQGKGIPGLASSRDIRIGGNIQIEIRTMP